MYKTHEMRMVRIEESGLEEWACPTCGRRMLLRWPPDYHKQVVEPGDQRACHVGSSADAAPPEPAEPAGTTTEGDTGGDTAAVAGQRCGRRWLRETGLEPPTGPARPRLNPPEPV